MSKSNHVLLREIISKPSAAGKKKGQVMVCIKESKNERKHVEKQKYRYLKIIVPIFTAGLKKLERNKI